MICPQTKAECGHLAFCDITGKCMEQEVGTMDQVDAEVRRAISRAEPPPPPTLAEIERLKDELLEKAAFTPYAHPHHYKAAKEAEAKADAALMAAIRAYGRE